MDENQGGETYFKYLNIKVKPVKNRCIVFFDCRAPKTKKYDMKTLHSGTKIKSGEKWAVNIWVREKKIW